MVLQYAGKTGGGEVVGDGSGEGGGEGIMGGGSAVNGGIDGVAGSTGLGIDPAELAMEEIVDSRLENHVDQLDSSDLHSGTHL